MNSQPSENLHFNLEEKYLQKLHNQEKNTKIKQLPRKK